MIGDRRRPVARYVRFAHEATQDRFVAAAEATYQAWTRLDAWDGEVRLQLPPSEPPGTVPERRGLLRRPRPPALPASGETLALSAALASAGRVALDVPGQVAALGGCRAGAALATAMGQVVLDLVTDLAPQRVSEQQAHPAYRQTLRLAAELDALHATTAEVGCLDPDGCVAARGAEQWGRRDEDVEVIEVRAVLARLAEAAARPGDAPA